MKPSSVQPKRFCDLVQDCSGASIDGKRDTIISSVAFDSRLVQPGSLFVALRGGYTDGHRFLNDALDRGAVAAVVEPDTSSDLTDGFQVIARIENTRAALAIIAARFFDEPSKELTLIGVTGTDGKTSTSTLIHHILTQAEQPAALMGTTGATMADGTTRKLLRQTTPESLDVQAFLRQAVDDDATACVLETTSHALEMHRVDECAFDIGVVTNVTQEHLDFHGTVENYRRAKGKLLEQVASTGDIGWCVLNADDEGTRAISEQANGTQILWYSAGGDSSANLTATSIRADSSGISFTIDGDWGRQSMRLPMLGSWNVSNALAALGATLPIGIPLDTSIEALSHPPLIPGRMQQIRQGQPFTVIVDYAHTPQSLRLTLNELRAVTAGRLMVLLGSAGERDVIKRGVLGAIAQELADYAIFSSEDPRFEDPDAIIAAIADGAREAGGREHVDFDCVEDRRSAIHEIVSRAQAGDTILLAGKGHETSMIYEAKHRPWNESQVASDALTALGFEARD